MPDEDAAAAFFRKDAFDLLRECVSLILFCPLVEIGVAIAIDTASANFRDEERLSFAGCFLNPTIELIQILFDRTIMIP